MKNKYEFKSIRPKLWEVTGNNGRALGRIRHVFSANSERTGWQASNGEFYKKAEEAAIALVQQKRETIALR